MRTGELLKMIMRNRKRDFLIFDRHIQRLTEEIGQERSEYIKAVAELYCGLNSFQMEYLENKLKERQVKVKKMSTIDVNTDWMSLIDKESVPPANPNYFKQQELMSEFTKWLKTQPGIDLGFGAVSGGSAAPAQAVAAEEKEEQKPEKKEKAVYDMFLVSFDAAKKISLIKEVRAITNLGLKESKDLVENLPGLIHKNIKKEETEEIIKKIEAAGGKIELK